MIKKDKQPAEFKITKEVLLAIAIISLIILIFYFALTVPPASLLKDLNNTSLYAEYIDKSYGWRNILLLLAMTSLLLLLYLIVTNRLYKVYRKLINSYIIFEYRITQSSKITGFIMMVIIVALAAVIRELYNNYCDQWIILSARLSSPEEPLNIRNIIIGIAGAITLVFAWRRLVIVDEQKEAQIDQTQSYIEKTEIAADRRLSEKFDNAVDALSKKLDGSTFPAHLGAISSLRALAIDSLKNTQRCLDIICSCNQWMEEYMNEFIEIGSSTPYSALLLNNDNRIAKKDNEITLLHERRSQEALVAISHILKKISTDNSKEIKTLSFHNKMLCGISLNNIKLDGIDFRNIHLVAASLDIISLKGANLDHANFQGASLRVAQLQGASLEWAQLQEASLINAQLQGASLEWAQLQEASLINAQLQGASLEGAQLQEASLINAQLQGASLEGAQLQEASLINTQLQGVTVDNVDLSNAILLSCNLYGVILKKIKGKNIIFNEIVNIDDIKDKETRKKWLDDTCKYIKSHKIEIFIKKMEGAWQAIEENIKPAGLDIIEENSIVDEDSEGMYYISEENLTKLQEVWQKRIDKKGKKFLWNLRFSILFLSSYINDKTELLSEDTTIDKNTNLVDDLLTLIKKID